MIGPLPAKTSDPGPPGTILAGRRVMIVEDELLISMLIEDTLTDRGCVIVGPYATVAEALAAASDAAVDLAVLDVNLRGHKVYPVAEMLAARGIPFVLLSGYGRDALPAEHPDWWVCSKPFRIEELTTLLAARLARTQA